MKNMLSPIPEITVTIVIMSLFCSCSDNDYPSYRPSNNSVTSAQATPQPQTSPYWWSYDGKTYRDRNHDGRIDWEVTGNDRHTDGYEIYKVDDDYDGFYDRVYKAGGNAFGTLWSREIHEQVPKIHRGMAPIAPTKVD